MRVARLGSGRAFGPPRATWPIYATVRDCDGSVKGKPADYREYLEVQQRRTLSKRENDPGAGARELVRRIVELGDLSRTSSVLCVGCRNAVELNLFRAAGGRQGGRHRPGRLDPDILVMDMHDMSFDDAVFDAVYASHSLEHAYDVGSGAVGGDREGRSGPARSSVSRCRWVKV